ncbi:MAG: hypothetical protein ACTSVL_06315 [Promethearchaeota archaeon]
MITIYPQIPYLSYFVGGFPSNNSFSLLLIIGIGFGKFIVSIFEGAIGMFLGFGCTFTIKHIIPAN